MPDGHIPDLACLSDHERLLVGLVADGKPLAEIASLFGIQRDSVARQLRNARRKLEATTDPQWQAVLQASRDEA